MRKIYLAFFTSLLVIVGLTGCKLDAPIYPDGTTVSAGTITYNISGTVTTLKLVGFQVIAASSAVPKGSTQIIGGTAQATAAFSLFFSGTTAGTYDIDILYINGLFGENGKVIVTELNVTSADGLHGTIKGTFTTDLSDLTTNQTTTGVTGTFNITI
jgi:hypothetical protein